jgi:predicted  nucleic acid-binding Zn-ribbon protein
MSVLTEGSPKPPELHESGERVTEMTAGSLICVECGFGISIAGLESLPTCPTCGGSRFRRASIFDQPTVDVAAVEVAEAEPEWLADARAEAERPGPHLAFEEAGEARVVALEEGWTRIGRSGAADVRLDDPTVSRRHALVVLTDEGELRALDDRSLNGLFVNGERVEWAPLGDGDELEIGRYRLYVIEA